MNLYVLKHTVDETELCMLEKKRLFDVISSENVFFTDKYIDVDRSPFVKFCIRDIILENSLESLIEYIKKNKVAYDDFKIKYIDIDGTVEFNRRHEIEGIIGYEIEGLARVDSPSVIVGVTQVKGEWIMGEYLKNNSLWYKHMLRPQEYCNALTTRVSRAVVNIATGNSIQKNIIDPCCGVGTVVMEALSMGLNIVGSDINEKIVQGAVRNLDYFNYPEVITLRSIHDINEHFDIAIIDLPYGIMSITNRLSQLEIIKSAKRIGDTLALIGVEDIEEDLGELGFHIIEKCTIAKGKFKRKLYIIN